MVEMDTCNECTERHRRCRPLPTAAACHGTRGPTLGGCLVLTHETILLSQPIKRTKRTPGCCRARSKPQASIWQLGSAARSAPSGPVGCASPGPNSWRHSRSVDSVCSSPSTATSASLQGGGRSCWAPAIRPGSGTPPKVPSGGHLQAERQFGLACAARLCTTARYEAQPSTVGALPTSGGGCGCWTCQAAAGRWAASAGAPAPAAPRCRRVEAEGAAQRWWQRVPRS